jgi:hypothetical protein
MSEKWGRIQIPAKIWASDAPPMVSVPFSLVVVGLEAVEAYPRQSRKKKTHANSSTTSVSREKSRCFSIPRSSGACVAEGVSPYASADGGDSAW